jgi:hypothetical protein
LDVALLKRSARTRSGREFIKVGTDAVSAGIRFTQPLLYNRRIPRVCGFIGFGKPMENVDGIRRLGLAASLKADVLKTTAEYFADEEPEA